MDNAENTVPKKIKIVISNFRLGKGRILPSGGINPLEEFYYNEKFVEFLNYYSTGIHKDYEVELVINGDFINFFQVDYKGHFLSALTESLSVELLKKVVDGHQKIFESLALFASRQGKSITYIIGNLDQPMLWPKCRLFLNKIVGSPIRYKNIVYNFDGFHVEHGHMHDALNRFDPKKFFLKKELPEPILNLPFGTHYFLNLILKVKFKYPYFDKVRPLNKFLWWVLLNHTSVWLSTVWNSIKFLANSLFTKNPKRGFSFKSLSKAFFQNAMVPDLTQSAKKLLVNERIHTVIFGQSQGYYYRQWEMDKEYFNVGSWTEVTSLDLASFGKNSKLTYVLIEYSDNDARPRARLKEWKGYYRIEEDIVVS